MRQIPIPVLVVVTALPKSTFNLPLVAWLSSSAISLLLHLGVVFNLGSFKATSEKVARSQVKITVIDPPAPPPPPPPEKPPEPKPKIKKKRAPTPPPMKAVQKDVKPAPDASPPKPIQGLSADSFAPDGKGGFSAPAGNTMMMEDTGERLRPEDIAQLTEDLSSDAKIKVDSFVKPEYTPEAADAGLEGRVILNFFVEKDGRVSSARLDKKVGYGMDERLIAAALKAVFSPRKDAIGRSEAGWARVAIDLVLP